MGSKQYSVVWRASKRYERDVSHVQKTPPKHLKKLKQVKNVGIYKKPAINK